MAEKMVLIKESLYKPVTIPKDDAIFELFPINMKQRAKIMYTEMRDRISLNSEGMVLYKNKNNLKGSSFLELAKYYMLQKTTFKPKQKPWDYELFKQIIDFDNYAGVKWESLYD